MDPSADASIPTIDLREPATEVALALDRACSQYGFAQIVGHDIAADIEGSAWQCARDFFALPVSDRLAVAIPQGEAYGYGPYLNERLAASRGSQTPADLKETFSIGPFDYPVNVDDIVDADPAAAFAYSPNRWPQAMPQMEQVMHSYYDELAALSSRLLSLMAVGLGASPHTFDASINEHTSALRLLHYPDVNHSQVQEGQLRAGSHSDYGTLTLLRQDDAPGGLEVQHRDGSWWPVPAVDGAYVLNIGDALERWTAGRWRSTLHRVQLPPANIERGTERQSIAFFHNANWDAVIDVLPECRVADVEVAEPITAGRHLMERFRSTQPSM